MTDSSSSSSTSSSISNTDYAPSSFEDSVQTRTATLRNIYSSNDIDENCDESFKASPQRTDAKIDLPFVGAHKFGDSKSRTFRKCQSVVQLPSQVRLAPNSHLTTPSEYRHKHRHTIQIPIAAAASIRLTVPASNTIYIQIKREHFLCGRLRQILDRCKVNLIHL